jgi:acyl-CoA thioester hydrolase
MVTAETEIREPPSGARFDRHITFRNAAGKAIVTSRTTWAMVDRASGRLLRVPAEVAAPFLTP